MPVPPASGEWRPYARKDWWRADLLLREHDPEGAGVFLQQAIEKYLKGWLLDRGWTLRKTHDLELLLDAAEQRDPSLGAFRALCRRVSGYYLLERYPAPGLGGPDESRVAADRDEVARLVAALFPDESLPS